MPTIAPASIPATVWRFSSTLETPQTMPLLAEPQNILCHIFFVFAMHRQKKQMYDRTESFYLRHRVSPQGEYHQHLHCLAISLVLQLQPDLLPLFLQAAQHLRRLFYNPQYQDAVIIN